MNDYTPIIIEMLTREYSNVPLGSKNSPVITPLFMSTSRILQMVRGIIPKNPIDEHDIFAIMQELGYRQVLKTIYHTDQDGNETQEIDYQIYLWELFPKKNLNLAV